MKKVAAVAANLFMFESQSQQPRQAQASLFACWNCGDEGVAPLECAQCQAIQPPRTLDPFTRLGLPLALDLDHNALLTAYRTQLMIVHPDRHLHKSPREQQFSQQQAAEISHAFRALQDFATRTEQVMQVEWGDDGAIGNAVGDAVMDPAVVQELFALQEVEQDHSLEKEDSQALLTMIQDKLAQCETTVREAFASRDRPRLQRELQRYRALDRFRTQHAVNATAPAAAEEGAP
jgi:hypothetical protein